MRVFGGVTLDPVLVTPIPPKVLTPGLFGKVPVPKRVTGAGPVPTEGLDRALGLELVLAGAALGVVPIIPVPGGELMMLPGAAVPAGALVPGPVPIPVAVVAVPAPPPVEIPEGEEAAPTPSAPPVFAGGALEAEFP